MATMAPEARKSAMRNGGMSMTEMVSFAQMLQALDPKIARHLKLPNWFFEEVCERKDQCEFDETQRERFLCAYQTLIGNGTLGQLVKIHGETHYQHGTQRFLPWHRIYLIILEHELQAIHPDVTIPYWDWTKQTEQAFPSWLAGVTPTVPMPPPLAPITVTRAPGSQSWLSTIASNVPGIEGIGDFPTFTSSLEGVHGGVHVWVGGTMSAIPTAPADPIFWMHHANIDRLWWEWHENHKDQNPNLTGLDAIMDPWRYDELQTRDIANFNYVYA